MAIGLLWVSVTIRRNETPGAFPRTTKTAKEKV